MEEDVRIDKWLWAVRVFKTRNQASEACRTGKVKTGGQAAKPSRVVKPGDDIFVHVGPIIRSLRVKGLLKNRVGAKLVEDYLLDLTPQEEYDKLKMLRETNYEYREKGLGRPTKRQRRLIDRLKKPN
ncbi:MAG: RNA-binding S4 domain-containing protein [Bacteroidales bacterium]|nr:RNA-binding S4 domain-containing protein [Bacteroidales bacterium]